MSSSLNQKSDKQIYCDFIGLVGEIKADMIKQPANRRNQGFYTTKKLFLKYGLSEHEHKLWRDRGMHAHMRAELLDQYNNLNPNNHLFDIEKVPIAPGFSVLIRYPAISWEELECHAAMIRVGEVKDKDEPGKMPSRKIISNPITIDQLVASALENGKDNARGILRSSLLRQCKRRKEVIANHGQVLPQPLYSSGEKFRNIMIIAFPGDNGAGEYLFQVSKYEIQ